MDLMIEQHEKYIKLEHSAETIEQYKSIKEKSEKEIINLINTKNNNYMHTFRLGWFGFDISFLFETCVVNDKL